MRKIPALVLALVLALGCAAALAEETAEPRIANYQFRNLTGDTIVLLTLTDNLTGDVESILDENEGFSNDTVIFLTITAVDEPEESLEHRFTLTFSDGDEEKVYEYKTLSFKDALIDLLAPDAMTGATPVRFNEKMYQVGRYKVINKTDKVLETVMITENADPDLARIFSPALDPDGFAYVEFIMEPEHEDKQALTIEFSFTDGTKCSYEKLSIEKASLTLTPDTITSATPFTFGGIDGE